MFYFFEESMWCPVIYHYMCCSTPHIDSQSGICFLPFFQSRTQQTFLLNLPVHAPDHSKTLSCLVICATNVCSVCKSAALIYRIKIILLRNTQLQEDSVFFSCSFQDMVIDVVSQTGTLQVAVSTDFTGIENIAV